MSPEKQRIAIATACGLTNAKPAIVRNVTHQGDDRTVGISSDSGWVPDYLNDLNAIAKARSILTPDQQIQFSFFVGKSVTRMLRVNQAEWMDFCLIDATAECQAEAFLRTLGLWEEDAQ